MEKFNENMVTLPELPKFLTMKEKLAWEVAGRIIEQMNRNDPENMYKTYINIHHHDDQERRVKIYVADGGLSEKFYYKSGSKVVEAVTEAIYNESCINYVTVEASFKDNVGIFVP